MDPTLSAQQASASWNPATDPFKILIVSAPAFSPSNLPATDIPIPAFCHDDGSARIIVADQIFDLLLQDIDDATYIAAALLLDDDAPDRLHALSRFWSTLHDDRPQPDTRLTAQRRTRLSAMLRAIDGHAEGATYRLIGEALFPDHQIDPRSWVGHSVREATIRLVRDGLTLVRGGYRELLRRRRRI